MGKIEKQEGAMLMKGRVLSSGNEGWFPSSSSTFAKWSPEYICMRSTSLKDGVADDAQILRALVKGEKLSVLRQPSRTDPGILHVQVQAEKDGAVGFAVVENVDGERKEVFLKSEINQS